MTNQDPEIDWSLTTWNGSRRAQLRQWQKLSLRERLQALEEMGEISRHFARLRAEGKFRDLSKIPDDDRTGIPKK